MLNFRIGNGFDIHKLVEGRKLILGGIEIPHNKGLLGHSDADVLVHAIIDSILGALALDDIGTHFPDTDEKFKNADSIKLLEKTLEMMDERNYAISNLDCNVIAQAPKLRPYILKIRENLAKFMGVDLSQISVKAKTNEGLDAVGEKLGISATCSVLLSLKNE